MITGGADRDQVHVVLATTLRDGPTDADGLLDALEDAGYAVVRAGQVPSIDPLVDVQGRLDLLARRGGSVQHDPGKARVAVDLIGELRRLACEVLAIDPDDVDDLNGPEQ